ncbi:MgtC/SapB family protein [Rhodoferax saidenbachensis]|uniref:Protein MgtC n=1 Tax=Rhodoferax saidenbachensis TaxID=1484693 RepID=A0A1P8K5S6_9BURK|nr:MgtC/SapB family protein [Rhodoferax saidenbachensis]APW41336.1 magnesium transporter MgtC [Rhodoferax saidenbachensis]
MFSADAFAAYWSWPILMANFFVLLHLMGALVLGLLVGYERSYHGRAAGMRTYGLVCMASAALTVIGGYSHYWYGGTATTVFSVGDLSRVLQGILTGIGFLCAGVIMKEGFNISGLTTAASLWASSVIGILVGVGLYPAAMALALLSAVCMVWISKLEQWLPSRQAVAISLKFDPGFVPVERALRKLAHAQGYDIAGGTIVISAEGNTQSWSFVAVARSRKTAAPVSELSAQIAQFQGVQSFNLAYARN